MKKRGYMNKKFKIILETAAVATAIFGLSVLPYTSIAKADALEQIASPVSNPVNFEDPRIESNIKPIFVHHELDDKFVTAGGDVQIYALQLRYAVNDRLAIIATKDGYVDFNPNSVLPKDKGFANLAAGAKYAFFKDSDSIATAGLRYEAPTGEKEVLQGTGDGAINPFFSGAMALGCEELPFNVVAGTGLRIPVSSHDSFFYDADVHFDTKVGIFSPLVEFNLVHVLDAGDRLPIADEGQDFFNFGAADSDGETMLTFAAGSRIDIAKDVSFGAAYQIPLIRGTGTRVTDWRLTTDLTFRF